MSPMWGRSGLQKREIPHSSRHPHDVISGVADARPASRPAMPPPSARHAGRPAARPPGQRATSRDKAVRIDGDAHALAATLAALRQAG
jgi:hypothetical protein